MKTNKHPWIAEFYPEPANNHTGCSIGHSLKKWVGLRPENLEKHNCELSSLNHVINADRNQDILSINDLSCSLCIKYHKQANCYNCPLYKIRNNTRCDSPFSSEYTSPWYKWIKQDDPEPMIKNLLKTQDQFVISTIQNDYTIIL